VISQKFVAFSEYMNFNVLAYVPHKFHMGGGGQKMKFFIILVGGRESDF
jgi:hypothetical protein